MADIKIIVDSSDVVTADNRVNQLGKSGSVAEKGIGKATRGMNQFGAVAKNGGKKLNTFNMQIQQGGYQLQDFVVQLQGGTSFFTAFGQQGSQFAGVFGPQGAVIGAVIAIGSAIGGIGYKALTASSAVKEFEDQLKDASSVMDEYISLASKADNVFASLFESSSSALSQTSQASKDLLLIAKTDALDSIRGLGKSLADANTEAGFWAKAMANTDKTVTGNLLNIDTALRGNITTWKNTGKQVQSFIDDVRNIGNADSVDGMYQSAIKARDTFQETVDVTGEMTEKQKTFWKELSTTILNLEIMGATLEATNGSWSDTKESVDAATASMRLFYEYAERDASAQEKRRKAVEDIATSLEASISADTRRVELAQAGANLDAVKAKHAREDFILQKQSEGVLGNNLVKAMKSYDAAQAALRVESDRVASLRQRAAEEKALAEANSKYEKDSAEAAEEAKKKAKELLDLTAKIGASTPYEPMSAVAVEAAKAQAEMIKIFEASTDLKDEIGDAAFEAIRLADVDISSGVSDAAKEAAKLAANLNISLLAAMNLKNLQESKVESGGRGSGVEYRGQKDYTSELGYESVQSQIDKFNKSKDKTKKDPIVEFQKKLDLERELLGVSEARQKVLQALGSDVVAKNPEIAAGMEAQITKTNELIATEERRQGLIDSITGSIEDGMMAMVDGTMSVKDAFKSMAAEIIKELYRVLVVQQMVNAAKGFFGFADGGAFSGGSQIQAYADGGVVGSPTTFPMSGGKTGLMGEAGPEAIMPLKRGANGKLGVQMEGGGGQNVVINQSFNFQANGDDSVKKLIAQAAPKIADMAKASVIESRRRGGSTKAAFG